MFCCITTRLSGAGSLPAADWKSASRRKAQCALSEPFAFRRAVFSRYFINRKRGERKYRSLRTCEVFEIGQAKPSVPPRKVPRLQWWGRRFRPMPHSFRGLVARALVRTASTFVSRFGAALKTHVETNLDAADMNVRATISTAQLWFFEKLSGIWRFRLPARLVAIILLSV